MENKSVVVTCSDHLSFDATSRKELHVQYPLVILYTVPVCSLVFMFRCHVAMYVFEKGNSTSKMWILLGRIQRDLHQGLAPSESERTFHISVLLGSWRMKFLSLSLWCFSWLLLASFCGHFWLILWLFFRIHLLSGVI